MACGTITAGVTVVDCTTLPGGGVDEALYLFNKDEIDLSSSVIAADGSITTLALTGSATGFKFDGFKSSLNPNISINTEGLIPTFEHEVQFSIFGITQSEMNQIKELALGSLVAVVDSSDQKLFAFGWNQGLSAEEGSWTMNDTATGGVPSITLRTPSNKPKEPAMPKQYLDTDYATTKTQLLALL